MQWIKNPTKDIQIEAVKQDVKVIIWIKCPCGEVKLMKEVINIAG